MKMTTSTTRLLCIRPDGERIDVTVAIGHPYPTSAGDWACPVEIDGLHGRLADLHGIDSLQALCLAIGLAGERLHAFVAGGGRILNPTTQEDVSLESYFSKRV
jgi:uncharacterized protein DUF6968